MNEFLDAWPVATYLGGAAVVFVLCRASAGVATEARRADAARIATAAVASLVALVAVVEAAAYLQAARAHVDGADFYYFLCTARDVVHGVPTPDAQRYGYFPGAMRVWAGLMRLGGERLEFVRSAHVAIVAANAVLVAAVVRKAAKSTCAAFVAALWYMALATRFRALEGTTESVSTLFALAGLLAWAWSPPEAAGIRRRVVAFGVGLGLAVWCKQQAGCIALGAAAFLAPRFGPIEGVKRRFASIAAMAATATVVLLIAMLCEGRGFAPLRTGLSVVTAYEWKPQEGVTTTAAFGEFARNLVEIPAAIVLAVALVVRRRGASDVKRTEVRMDVAAFAAVATVASLLQFAVRLYPHYFLLGAPMFVVAASCAWVESWRRLPVHWTSRPGASVAATALLALPLVASTGEREAFRAWPPCFAPSDGMPRPWDRDPRMVDAIDAMRSRVREGEDAIVLPPRRNVLHLALGTRSLSYRLGYGYGVRDAPAADALRSPMLAAVVVIDRAVLEEMDRVVWAQQECDDAVAALRASGFSAVVRTDGASLWRRSP